MSSLTDILQQRFADAFERSLGTELRDSDPVLRPSANPKFGDYQANCAMGLGKKVGKNPREVAQLIIDALQIDDLCDKIEIAGPGFINLTFSSGFLSEQINAIASDERLGVPTCPDAATVVVDYSSPNVAKEMHVGHLRSTIIGDAVVRMLEFLGYSVIRQNHVGDWGTQFGRVMLGLWYESVAYASDDVSTLNELMRKVIAATRKPEKDDVEAMAQRERLLVEVVEEVAAFHQKAIALDPDGTQHFEPYLAEHFPELSRLQDLYAFTSKVCAAEAAKTQAIEHPKHGKHTLAELPSFIATFVQQQHLDGNAQEKAAWELSRDVSLKACQRVYDRLGVLLNMDDVCGESFYNDRLPGVVQRLADDGQLHASDGAQVVYPDGFKDRDDNPLGMIVQKSDGGYLYATTDLAAAMYRVTELGAKRVIYVIGSPQKQHFDMFVQTMRQAGWIGDDIRMDFAGFGSVLGKDRKMYSTRSGDTIRLIDLLNEAESRSRQTVQAKAEERGETFQAAKLDEIAAVVGIGALKYADLSSDRTKDYIFDWDRMLSFDGNTAPYIQFSYTRARSIRRKAASRDIAFNDSAPIIAGEPVERELVLKIMQFDQVVVGAADSLEPHIVCTYLYELASICHSFFEKCPVLRADDDATRDSRLRLCELVATVLKAGLGLLGIGVVEQM